jgi:outer membrane protein assembly factor BamB
MTRSHLVPAAALVLVLSASPFAANWSQWRGPGSQGISPEVGLPTEWGPATNVAWKTPIPGRGHSSPIVWNDRVFLTTAIEGAVVPGAKAVVHIENGKEFLHPDSVGADRRHALKVLCLDLATGRVIWERTAYDGTMYDDRHRRGSYASPTPVTDGRLVYAYFGTEGLYAYDFDGRLAWKAAVGRIPTFGMGVGTSPILYENLLIVQSDENTGERSAIVAFERATGKEVWRTPRAVQASWSTPVLVSAGSRTELVTNGNELIVSYDPATGKELWRAKGVESNAIHTPLAGSGLVIVTAGYPARRVIAIAPGGSGVIDGTSFVRWQYDKGTAYVVSPILYGGRVYLVSDKGIITCLDAATGAVIYEGGRVPVPASFMASPLAFDGKILLTSEDGDTFVLDAGTAHRIVRTNSLAEPVYSTPALSQGRILIRGDRHLYCIRN